MTVDLLCCILIVVFVLLILIYMAKQCKEGFTEGRGKLMPDDRVITRYHEANLMPKLYGQDHLSAM